MSAAQGLKRLARVYRTLEQMRSLELRISSVRLAEVEEAQTREMLADLSLRQAGRMALTAGSVVDWNAAELGRQACLVREERLRIISTERLAAHQDATQAHQASHLSLKQIERVVESARQQRALVSSRRMQASSDDRYASRREWTRRSVDQGEVTNRSRDARSMKRF